MCAAFAVESFSLGKKLLLKIQLKSLSTMETIGWPAQHDTLNNFSPPAGVFFFNQAELQALIEASPEAQSMQVFGPRDTF